jgi:hypothetical protein
MTSTTTSSAFAVYVLAQLRVAAAHARLTVTEIDSISAALNGNFVLVDEAIAWATGIGITLASS